MQEERTGRMSAPSERGPNPSGSVSETQHTTTKSSTIMTSTPPHRIKTTEFSSAAALLAASSRTPITSQDTALALPFLEKLRLLVFTPIYVLFGAAVLASSPILAAISKTSKTAKRLVYFLCLRTIIPTLRYFLDTVPTWLVLTWWLRSKNIAQDGVRVMKDIALGEPCHYGSHSREWAQCLHPCGLENRKRNDGDRVILFCHGGGHLVSSLNIVV